VVNQTNELYALLEKLKKDIVNGEKYFHLNTLCNFILHFNEIKTVNDKRWIFESLKSYFVECSEYLDSMDRNTSHLLYVKYLNKVGDYYRNFLGFSIYTSLEIVLFLIIIVALLLKLLVFTWFYCMAFAIICSLSYIIFISYKKKLKKTFGLFH